MLKAGKQFIHEPSGSDQYSIPNSQFLSDPE
jgi:hypothetical protein